ncbi:TlpA family protein disulfide reductase [Ningiella sp. W23]|uniref:TlpA family protein disulfide reductase n=1 Tax=Ningiella sp. W23 TaxID=3023715 RepID=UPI00375690EB
MTSINLGFVSFTLSPVLLLISILIGLVVTGILAKKHKQYRKSLLSGAFTAIGTYAVFALIISVASSHAVLPNTSFAQLNGEPTQISDISAGRLTVVNLWATTCPPCRREMPIFEAAQKRYSDVAFISLNQRESIQSVEQFFKREGIKLEHVLLDSKGEIATNKGVFSLPVTLFFDGNGQLVYSHTGPVTQTSLTQAIEQYL